MRQVERHRTQRVGWLRPALPDAHDGVSDAQINPGLPASAGSGWSGQLSAGDRSEIIAGLVGFDATISPKFFYDHAGSTLFERITRLPEYYPTRTERAIMQRHRREISLRISAGKTVIELGAGNCEKGKALCALIRPKCFIAVDISQDFLHRAVAGLQQALPKLEVRPVVADLMEDIVLPGDLPGGKRLVYYPGSSIGNFDPEPALALLRRVCRLVGEGGSLLIGVDLIKDQAVLEAAYNDAEGVTAEFNLNALAHLNRLIGSDFDRRDWQHVAFFNRQRSRIEMHLQASVNTRVCWPDGERHFRRGERIHTENSYKYDVDDFARVLDSAGFKQHVFWTDPRRWFAVFYAQV